MEIRESRPLSRLKRWTLLRVVEKSREVDISALRAARRSQSNEQSKVIDDLTESEAQAEGESPAIQESGE